MIIKLRDLTVWHRYFCLFPIVIYNKLVWLEYVERRINMETHNQKWEFRLLPTNSKLTSRVDLGVGRKNS